MLEVTSAQENTSKPICLTILDTKPNKSIVKK